MLARVILGVGRGELAVAGVYPCPACSLSSSVDYREECCVNVVCSYSCVWVCVLVRVVMYICMYLQYLCHHADRCVCVCVCMGVWVWVCVFPAQGEFQSVKVDKMFLQHEFGCRGAEQRLSV